eukprot:gene11801-18210_t
MKNEEYNYYNSNLETDTEGNTNFVLGFTFGDKGDDKGDIEAPSVDAPTREQIRECRSKSDALRREAVCDTVDGDSVPNEFPKTESEKELLYAVVSSHPLLKALHENERNVIVRVLEKDTFNSGDTILQQGSNGHN